MRVETLYTDSSGTYRVTADIRENNRTAHVLSIVDNDYGGDADWDDFSRDEQAAIHQLLLEEYDAVTGDDELEADDSSDEDGGDPPSDY